MSITKTFTLWTNTFITLSIRYCNCFHLPTFYLTYLMSSLTSSGTLHKIVYDCNNEQITYHTPWSSPPVSATRTTTTTLLFIGFGSSITKSIINCYIVLIKINADHSSALHAQTTIRYTLQKNKFY